MTRALIFGISGQDGAYLSRLLLEKGYEVHGTSRDAEMQSFWRLDALELRDRVQIHSASTRDFHNLLQLVEAVQPDEIYNLAGQSSVGLSFEQPIETIESIATAQLLILEVIRFLKRPIRLYHASSSECYGQTPPGSACNELTPFAPRSPYATAKAAAHWSTVNYREAYGLFACSGVLFNHESPLRSERFVTRKIVRAATEIAAGVRNEVHLGNLQVSRDWGYAPEYVEAMWRMLQLDTPNDLVIATGEAHTLEEFTAAVFSRFGLDWRQHVRIDESLFRPSELAYNRGDAAKAAELIGWQASTDLPRLVELLTNGC